MPTIQEAIRAARQRASAQAGAQRKELQYGPPQRARGQYGRPIRPTWSIDRAASRDFSQSVLVYRAVMGLASALGSVRWIVETRNGNTWEAEEDHPLQGLLNQPHPYFARQDFNELLGQHLALSGNALFQKTLLTRTEPGATRRAIGELVPLIPETIAPVPHETEWLAGYVLRSDTTRIKWKPEEMLHFMVRDPINMYWGQSPLRAAGGVIRMDIASVVWNTESMENRAISDGALTTEQSLTDAQYEELQDQVYEQHMQGRRGPPWLLQRGFKWEQFANTPAEMDFIETRKMNREEILSALGMPPVVAGYFEQATLANAEVSRRLFWEDNVIPAFVERVAGGFNAHLVPHFGDSAKLRVGYDISGIPALREDQLKKAVVLDRLCRTGTPYNHALDELEMDLPRIEGAGDVPYGLEQFKNKRAENTPEPEGVLPAPEPPDPPVKPGARTPAQEAELEEGKALRPAHAKAGGIGIEAGIFTTEIADAEADGFRRAFLAVLKALRGDVSLAALRDALTRADGPAALAQLGDARIDAELRAGLGSRLEATARRAALRALADLEAQVQAGMALDAGRVRRWLVPYLEERVAQLSATTRAAVQETVAEWAAGKLGADIDAVAELVRGSWGVHRQQAAGLRNFYSALLSQGKTPSAAVTQALKLAGAYLAERAETIAAHESIVAANRGATIPWEQAMDEGRVVGAVATWFTADDERVESECLSLDGQEIRLGSGEAFVTAGGSRVFEPPLHPGCRCGRLLSAIATDPF